MTRRRRALLWRRRPAPAAAAAAAAASEAGFTIVELLIVIVIESLIVAGLGSAFVLLMNNSATVKDSLTRTNDARFAAAYIVSDAANSSGPETSLADTTSCPDASPPVAGSATAVARFSWNSTASSGATTANVVNYVLVSNSLLRRFCQNGTLVNDDALASSIASASVACSPNANCSGAPKTVTATITETQDSNGGAAYQYSLTGAFRKALFTGAALPAGPTNPYAFIALGGGGCAPGATGVKAASAAGIHVYGDAYLNTADGPTCTAMSLASNSIFQADAVRVLTGGTCSGAGTCPPLTPYSPAITDPYAAVTPPSTSGMTARSGCAGGVAQPGVYASTLAIGSGTCQLASGIYVLQNGMTTGGSATITSAAGGVLIYVTGGSVAVDGNSTVTLAATTAGSYTGMTFWQDAADTNAFSIGNSANVTITGAVYTPAAQLAISGSASPTFTHVVTQVLVMAANGTMTIGTP